MQQDEYKVYCVEDLAAHKNHRIVDVAIPVFDTVREKVVPVLFDVKDVADENTNWQKAHHAFIRVELQKLQYDHFLVFYSKHRFTTKEPRKAEVEKNSVSSADCRRNVLSLLGSDVGQHMCIIEGT